MSNISRVVLQSDWPQGQSVDFPYPDRTTGSDFNASGHTAVVDSLGYSITAIAVSFGASSISVTNNSTRKVPRGEEILLSLAEKDESATSGAGAGLSDQQVAAGASAVVGTDEFNNLYNKTGGAAFNATFIPRSMPLESLLQLVNGGGEIAVSSDSPHMVKLNVNPVFGEANVFYAMTAHCYDYDAHAFHELGNKTLPKLVSIPSEFNVDGVPSNLGLISQEIKDQIVLQTAPSGGKGLGQAMASGVYSNSAHGYIFMMKTFITDYSTSGNTLETGTEYIGTGASLMISNEDFTYIPLSINLDHVGGNSNMMIASGSGNGVPIKLAVCDPTGSLTFFNADPSTAVTKRDPANLGSGGSRVGTTGNAVTDAATFTGGIGTSAYTIGQVVKALKQYGLLAE